MRYRFHPDAEAELSSAIEYYENVEPGLGQDFAVEVFSAVQRVIAYPHAWAALKKKFGVHWCGDFRMGFYTPWKAMRSWL